MPSPSTTHAVRLDILREDRSALYDSTVRLLRGEVKELPPLWLYDDRGSRLYEEITQLREYYLPRREDEILRKQAPAIAERTRARTLVELGAGSATNTRHLLDALTGAGTLERFVPLDVNEHVLRASAQAVADAYPRVSVHAFAGDFERDLDALPADGDQLIALLGSTIGNLHRAQREVFLRTMAAALGADDAFLVGIDLVKDVARLEAAYNDGRGVTEAFARNALTAVNRELGATFEQRRYAYEARWDAERERMDIGFRARHAHAVSIQGLALELRFEQGELLRVEISSKFRRERFALDVAAAGLRLDAWWTDTAGDFAVALVLRDTPAS